MPSIEEVIRLVEKPPTEEVLTRVRLRGYLDAGVHLKHYIGFEISGYVHLGTGIVTMQKIADLQEAGIETTVFLADYHSWINRKLGGDLDTIKRVAGGYFKEALRISLEAVGGDPDRVEYVMGSELYEELGLEYFEKVLRVSMKTTLSRIRRSITIMGRRMGESISFAQLIYVPMQVADIFAMNINLAHGGMDQRKAHVIAIDVGGEFGYKPVAVHHHLLMGLKITEEQWRLIREARERGEREKLEEGIIDVKMSKSKPETAIFIHDEPGVIRRKIRKAYCPPRITEFNPVYEIGKYIVAPWLERHGREIILVNKKTGEERHYNTWTEIEKDYREGRIHPLDFKNMVAEYLVEILEPARKYFREGPGKKYLEELEGLRITR